MKLTVVRHGETIENSLSICQGQSEGTLSGQGLEQAGKVALRLQNEEFDIAFSSDLKRASKTAEKILEYHPNVQLKLDMRLRERYFGSLQGQQVQGYDINDCLPEDAESNLSIVIRHKELFQELYEQYPDKHILIVSHGIAKKALLTAVFNLQHERLNDLERFGNTSVTIIEKEVGKEPIAILRNCMSHL